MRGIKLFSITGKGLFYRSLFLFFVIILISFEMLFAQVNRTETGKDNLEAALKVINFLEQVADKYRVTGKYQGKTAVFTEEEISAFFQEILTGSAPAVKNITLKLFANNRIEGWLVLSFKCMDIPPYMKDEVNLYFSGVAEVKMNKIRLNFGDLYLETQKIQPAAINALIEMVSSSQNLEAKKLDDWYDLPAGIAGLSTERGMLKVKY